MNTKQKRSDQDDDDEVIFTLSHPQSKTIRVSPEKEHRPSEKSSTMLVNDNSVDFSQASVASHLESTEANECDNLSNLMLPSNLIDRTILNNAGRNEVRAEALQGGLFLVFVESGPGMDGFHYALRLALNPTSQEHVFVKQNGIVGIVGLSKKPNSDDFLVNKFSSTSGKSKGVTFGRRAFLVVENENNFEKRTQIMQNIVKVTFLKRSISIFYLN